MPYFVNGEIVPEELIRQETERLSRDLRLQAIPDKAVRAKHLRAAAEQSAVERILLEQAAVSDPRPIDSESIEGEVRRVRAGGNYQRAFNDATVRQWIEKQLRLQRTTSEMVAGAAKPKDEEIEAFYKANRGKFRKPEMFHAAHIFKQVTHAQSEEQAEAAILVALAELERGDPFAEVAERHSDCKGNGGDLGQFPAGQMVQEFDDAIGDLEPGQRTGVFTTPFGFHIAELRAKVPARPASFDEVRADIERVMMLASQHEAYTRCIAELCVRAKIRFVAQAPTAAS
jgi:parvulin-like peptidyl-prolyl isomerase